MVDVPPPDDRGLARALLAHPDARITAMLPSGEFTSVPPECAATQEHLPGRTFFDLLPASEWPTVTAGWRRLHKTGTHACVTRDNDGNDVSVLSFDVRDQYGVFVSLLIPDPGPGLAATDDLVPATSRFGTYHRDRAGKVLGQDTSAEALLGWELERLAEVPGNALIHPDDAAEGGDHWNAVLSNPGQPLRWRGRHLQPDGYYRWIEFTDTNRLDDLGYVVSGMTDIAEEMVTARALRRRDELLTRLNDALPLGVIEIDRDYRIVYANNRLPAIVGRDHASTLDEQFEKLAPVDRTTLLFCVTRALTEGTDADVDLQLRIAAEPEVDRVCAVSIRALRDEGHITGAVLTVSDVTDAAVLRRELEHQARFDRLTGCSNRAAIMAALEQELARPDRSPAGTAVLFIDLDGFKPINDELGHAAGDNLLVAVAERLRGAIREGDLIGRIGGDEFLVVCPGIDASGGEEVARRIGDLLGTPIDLDGTEVRIGASIGVAWSADPTTTADAIVASSDAAMYAVKRTRAGTRAR